MIFRSVDTLNSVSVQRRFFVVSVELVKTLKITLRYIKVIKISLSYITFTFCIMREITYNLMLHSVIAVLKIALWM